MSGNIRNDVMALFEKHIDIKVVYVRRIYITPTFIIGEMDDGKYMRFYTILSNWGYDGLLQ